MRGLNSLPLDDDIIDRILIFLPDFRSLHATIQASKSFYAVFSAHPNSIVRAVSYNVTGPALPDALRLIRFQPPQYESDSEAEESDPFKPHTQPWTGISTTSPISTDEARDLDHNAIIVGDLEHLFSSRHKDRKSQSSKLSSMESWRFRRAMYRLMLFSKVFSFVDTDEDDLDELKLLRRNRKEFLQEFSSVELLELHSVSVFLVEIANWCAVGDIDSVSGIDHYEDYSLCAGPAKIHAGYEAVSAEDILSDLEDLDNIVPEAIHEYLSHPLARIRQERKDKPPPTDASHWKAILDEIRGENDICHQCSAICGFDLWNSTNWKYLEGLSSTSPHRFLFLLKGNLAQNLVEPTFLRSQIYGEIFTYSTFMNELFDVKTAAYDSWHTDDWICESCIIEFLRDHLHLWLLERRRASGDPIPEDCWYGYNCRTQTHKMYHVKRVNHLCEPTR